MLLFISRVSTIAWGVCIGIFAFLLSSSLLITCSEVAQADPYTTVEGHTCSDSNIGLQFPKGFPAFQMEKLIVAGMAYCAAQSKEEPCLAGVVVQGDEVKKKITSIDIFCQPEPMPKIPIKKETEARSIRDVK